MEFFLDFFWIFFCLLPFEAVKGSLVARMGRFDDYPGFQPKRV
jgi:hypothetical protein